MQNPEVQNWLPTLEERREMINLHSELQSMELVCEKLGVHEYSNCQTFYFKLLKKFKLEFQVTDLYKRSKTESDDPFDYMMKCYKICRSENKCTFQLSDESTNRLIEYYLDYYINCPNDNPIYLFTGPSRTDLYGRSRNDPYPFLF